jgi:hypothetical protein
MPAANRPRTAQHTVLLESLEQRLDQLTATLNAAEIAEKSIDIVKEIKELHAILRSIREVETPERPQKVVVVWGGPPTAASGRVSRQDGNAKKTQQKQSDN